MPFSKMPKSVKSGVKHKHKKHGSKIWMSTYESARKQGKSKESAAKIAYGAISKESLSLSSIYESLLEAYPSKPTLGGRGQKILYKHIVPVLNSNWPGWETKFPQLKANWIPMETSTKQRCHQLLTGPRQRP